MMLGGNPAAGSSPTTNLLYAGEQFDTNSQNYYLRARYYDPSNGRFNRLDPYAGNSQDPQSLHKYLYCHANPVNGIDPSGMFTIVELVLVIAIIAIAVFLIASAIYNIWYATEKRYYGKYIGSEIGYWLFKYMKSEAQMIESGKGSWARAGRWVTSGLKTNPPRTQEEIENEEVQSVKIFGKVVPSDVGGNIMYGFIGRIAGYRLDALLKHADTADRFQKGWRGDDPEDIAAATFGYELAEKYADLITDRFIVWQTFNWKIFATEFRNYGDLHIMTDPVKDLKPHNPPFTLAEKPRW